MGVEATRNSFRAAVLRGEKPELVVTDKAPRRKRKSGSNTNEMVSRSETRRGDHRQKDRHRLTAESAKVTYEGKTRPVELINLSSGGAMIRCDFELRLWDLVELHLSDDARFEGAVRWIKDDHAGLEFAHETLIDCDPRKRAELLLEVIRRTFPEQEVLDRPVEEKVAQETVEEDLGNRVEKRHPLIWKGEIHYAFDSHPVRLRNISAGGALVDVRTYYPLGAEVMLDLGDAGQFEAVVGWGEEDQVGLKFKAPFDIACLAKAKPDVTPNSWQVPSFLNQVEDDSPWHHNWSRSSISEIRNDLEGFLKR